MQSSDQINELAAALAKVQSVLQNPDRNRTVTVTSRKTGTTYNFDYATLDNIFNMIRKPLADAGLSFVQALDVVEEGKIRLITFLMHVSGQWIKTATPVRLAPEENGMQALGSAQSYARRYAITALLGIAAEDDDDSNIADGNKVKRGRAMNKLERVLDARPEPSRTEIWSQQQRAIIADFKVREQVTAWVEANEKHLKKLAEQDPGVHDDLMAYIDRMAEELPKDIT